MEKEALTIELFSTVFCVGRTQIYEEIKTGRLPTYKLGRRRYISAQAAKKWQAELEATNGNGGSK